MKALVFDSSTIISLAMNNLLWILKPLKKQFKGDFYIPLEVKKESVDKALTIRRFKFEAIQIVNEIKEGTIKVYSEDLHQEVVKLDDLANKIFWCNGKPIKIIDEGEIAALVLMNKLNAEAFMVDERTTRLLLESPREIAKILRKKLNKKVEINGKNLHSFQAEMKDVTVLRSVEMGVVAYEMGLFDKYKKDVSDKELLDALLWGLRLKGCSISTDEIKEIIEKVATV